MKFGSFRFSLSILLVFLFATPPMALAQKPARKPSTVLTRDQRIRHVLSRLTYGARPSDAELVEKMGIKAFIEQQLNPEFIDDAEMPKRLAGLPTLMLPTPTIAEQYNPPPPPIPSPTPVATPSPLPSPNATPTPMPTPTAATVETTAPPIDVVQPPKPAVAVKPSPTPAPKPAPNPKNPQAVVTELQRAKILRAVYSERQLYEVVVDFWENHFSIFAQKDADRWMMTSFDRDSIRPYAFGRFRDLLGATAKSPAMLYYLDNWQSSLLRKYPATKDKPAREAGGLNENYARELMELHTLGVDGGYTQKDVQEVARCFTGWTIRKPNQEGTFIYNPAVHDDGEKLVLGQKIPAGGGLRDAETVLDILAKHPSTAKFIATKLATRFLGDDPPKTAIDRAAKVFLKTDGSIRETLRSLVISPEFFSPSLYRAKIRSPFEFAVAALRATAARTDANRPVIDFVARMGQPIFGHRTPEGVPERGDQWLSNNGLLSRINFASSLVSGQVKGSAIDAKAMLDETDAQDPTAVAVRLSQIILMNEVSPGTKKEIDRIASESASKLKMETTSASLVPGTAWAPKTAPAKMPDHVGELLVLALGAPEFQRK